jgi:hypothetical protein
MFGDFLAYVKFNQKRQKLIEWPPFNELRPWHISGSGVNYIHSFLDLYGVYIFETLLVLPVAGPIGVFCGLWVGYLGLLRHMDVFRYALPGAVFGTIVGLDKLWSHRFGYAAVLCLAPVYLVEMVVYSVGQINSNRCSGGFMRDVLDSALDHIH